ncbi:TPA: hypothetical protein ACQ8UR_004535 [Escherichia coli]
MSSSVESIYKQFIQHKAEFLAAAHACAKFADVDDTGVASRPVVVVSESDYPVWHERIERWKSLTDELSAVDPRRYPPSSADMYPIPLLLENVRGARISYTTATTTINLTAAEIIKRINAAMKKAAKAKDNSAVAAHCADIERFIAYDPAHLFRLRKSGFRDMQARLYVIGQSKRETVHVTAHGLFIREKNLDSTGVELAEKRERFSVYEHIAPIPCHAIPTYLVYDIDDVATVTAQFEENIRQELRRASLRKAQRKYRNKQVVPTEN